MHCHFKKDFFLYGNKMSRGKEGIGDLKVDDSVVSDGRAKADHFNEFLASVYLNPRLASSYHLLFSSTHPNDCSAVHISPDAVAGKLRHLKSKCCLTPDAIPPFIIKKLVEHLAVSLLLILTRF
jgi:hypothetical protein